MGASDEPLQTLGSDSRAVCDVEEARDRLVEHRWKFLVLRHDMARRANEPGDMLAACELCVVWHRLSLRMLAQ